MTVSNIKYYPGIPQEEYFKLPGFSFSSIKALGVEGFVETENMKLGTAVHQYLLEPHAYEHTVNSKQIKALAMAAKKAVGSLIDYCEPEVGMTADFEHEGFVLPYRGKSDLRIHKRLVIDFKFIGGKSIHSTIDMFDYHDQQSGYAYGNECNLAFIIAVNRNNLNTEVVKVKIRPDWWKNKILIHGKPN